MSETEDFNPAATPPKPVNPVDGQLTPGRRLCGCGRVAQRDYDWCWFCSPLIPAEVKLAARRKRTHAVLEDVDLSTPMSRRHAREALAQAVLDGDASDTRANVVRSIIADQAREDDTTRGQAPEKAPVVLVQSFRPPSAGDSA